LNYVMRYPALSSAERRLSLRTRPKYGVNYAITAIPTGLRRGAEFIGRMVDSDWQWLTRVGIDAYPLAWATDAVAQIAPFVNRVTEGST